MKNVYISVVVPTFNEEENIKDLITELDTFLKTLNRNYEIIVVNDGSYDSTANIVSLLVKDISNLRLVSHNRNLGIGAALKTGYQNSRGTLISWVAADGQNPPYELKKLLANINNNDMIISIYEKRDDSFLRYLLSKSWRILVKVIVGYNLETQGPYLFKRALLSQVSLYSKTGLMNLEFPNKIKRIGFRLRTVPVICKSRKGGKSKIANLHSMVDILKEMFKLRYENKR